MNTVRVNSWKDGAACAGMSDDTFYPTESSLAAAASALAVCDRCEVRAACLQYALDLDIRDGIWGGMIPQQRAYFRRKAKKPRRTMTREEVDHGTDKGAQWHRRNGEKPCPDCKQAELERCRAKSHERYMRRRAARQLEGAQ